MSRHAYCISAHNDSYCLQTLVNLIDDDRNDIFIVSDKKADSLDLSVIKTNKSRLITPPDSQLIDIQWGDASLVKAELLAFRMALKQGKYEYLHLLSGCDLPLKDQDYIHGFFNSLKKGINLVGFAQGEFNKNDLAKKTDYYHFFIGKYRYPLRYVRGLFTVYRNTMVHLQKTIGFKRKWDMKLYKGSEWVSITSAFAKYLVDNEDLILKMFRYVSCADEIYKQTFIMASPYKETIFDTTLDFAGMTRKIDWSRGCPYTWHSHDFDELVNSEALFARKFSSLTDRNIIDRIANYLTNHGRNETATDKDTCSLPQG